MFLFILLLPKHFIAGFLKSDLKLSDEVCLKRDFSLIYCEWRMWPIICLPSEPFKKLLSWPRTYPVSVYVSWTFKMNIYFLSVEFKTTCWLSNFVLSIKLFRITCYLILSKPTCQKPIRLCKNLLVLIPFVNLFLLIYTLCIEQLCNLVHILHTVLLCLCQLSNTCKTPSTVPSIE